jgi:subtilisin family serine protease
MRWHVYVVLAISLFLSFTGFTSWFQWREYDPLQRRWVVRFNDATPLNDIPWPTGIETISLHDPAGCVVIESALSESQLRTLLAEYNHFGYLSPAKEDAYGSPVYPTGSALIALDAKADPSQIAQQLKSEMEASFDQLHWIKLRIPQAESFESFRLRCMSLTGVKDVFPDEIIVCHAHQTNDPLYNSSWHIAQSNDKDIDADEGWNLIPSSAATKSITLIEGVGFDTLNADLSGRFVDRYNAVNQTTNVYSNATVDKHGTAVAGIPGAIWNNAISAAGLGKNKLLLQVIRIGYNTTASGTFSTSSSYQAAAINRAMSLSTTVAISMSFGSTTYQTAFYNAIQSALTQGRSNKGIPVFASSGNSGLSTWTNYPASYANVIAVGNTTSQDLRATTSNYGPALTLSAPGTSIATTDITGANGYGTGDNTFFSGTSAAAPVAASVGALMIVTNPNLTAAQIKQYLAQSCEKVGGYTYTNNATQNLSTWCNELGYGRVNMRAALQLCLPQTPGVPDLFLSTSSISSTSPTVGTSVTIQTTQNTSSPNAASIAPVLEYRYSIDATWSADDIVVGTDVSQLGNGVGSENESITFTIPAGTGARYLLLMADASSQITESNEGNNLIALPINVVAGSGLPDIFITNATVSSSTVAVGQSITINAIQNRNPFPSTTSFASLQYRFSLDAAWESTDSFIGSDISTFTATIGAEAENITYTIPNSPGVRYILLQCDASNTTAESNENNNVIAIPITIVAAAIQEPLNRPTDRTNSLKCQVYPNPSQEILFIDGDLETISAAWIMRQDGQLCQTISMENLQTGINISALDPGIYVLSISDGSRYFNSRFIKE